ncbi:MAG: putative periplasmic rane protein [Myxococcaceae bacterium]|nr:putative periplasmic rane protein [Myxococcaceae bacterium]
MRSSHASITPVQAIDVYLCWGWIDAVRKGLDEVSFLQRYCPRGKKSVWSQIDVTNIERLTAAGRMKKGETIHPQGTPKAAPKSPRDESVHSSATDGQGGGRGAPESTPAGGELRTPGPR